MDVHSRYFRHLMCDNVSLSRYFRECKWVNLKELKRSLMLLERLDNVMMPDHHYRLGLQCAFERINKMSDIFTVGMFRMSDYFLENRDGRIYVKSDLMNEWQLTLPYISPLLLISLKIWDVSQGSSCQGKSAETFIREIIAPNVRYTALPSPYIPELEALKRENGGLYDLHFHLSNALEADRVWLDLLAFPDEAYNKLAPINGNERVLEQYEELTDLRSVEEFGDLIFIANNIRWKILDYICSNENSIPRDGRHLQKLLVELNTKGDVQGAHDHPVQSILPKWSNKLEMECYFYILIMDRLKEKGEDLIAKLFHYYLLIMGLINRMLVLQPFMIGFEEFQKYTKNGFRRIVERDAYKDRFLQINGNDIDNVGYSELRISLVEDDLKNEELIGSANAGWDELVNIQKATNAEIVSEHSFLVHFLKNEKKEFPISLQRQALRLVEINGSLYFRARKIVGIDAAGSEFMASPDVFAPSYNLLREKGFCHFTYHAGEDFYHLLGGLRAIYEAVEFLGLTSGDRIGHASAAGTPVDLWRRHMGRTMLIHRGQYLDDLIFAYYLIKENDDDTLKSLLPSLVERIESCGYDIYGERISVTILMLAWQKRKNSLEQIEQGYTKHQEDKSLYVCLLYHQERVRLKRKETIVVPTLEILDEKALKKMQFLVLRELSKREIVIETLPTSNVLIGHHHDFSTYHLYNWYKWGRKATRYHPSWWERMMRGCLLPIFIMSIAISIVCSSIMTATLRRL